MASVITFWQLPDDECNFMDFLQSTGDVVALTNRWVENKEDLKPKPILSFIQEHHPTTLYFGIADQVTQCEIEVKKKDEKQMYSFPVMETNFIGYTRSTFRDGKLTQSNLHFYSQYPHENGALLIDKDEAFIKWAKKVLAWVRKNTPERVSCNGYPYRATRNVKVAVESGMIEVALY